MDRIRVVLIEDHDLTRMGLRTALQQQADNIDLIDEAANGTDGFRLLTTLKPDVAIVDIGLPDIDGIELTRKFKQFQSERPEVPTKVLILTMHDDELEVLSAFAAGADSYCIKNIHIQQLLEAIKTTAEGQSWIDPAIAEIVLQQIRSGDLEPQQQETISINALTTEEGEIIQAYPLTERELDVLELIVGGYSNSRIAEKLYISLGTVKTHVRNILDKLAVSDRTEAAVRALRAGLVK